MYANPHPCIDYGQLYTGRADKRFCSDVCRSTLSNKERADTRKTIDRINRILRGNRKILVALNPEGTNKVPRIELESRDFLFDFITNIHKSKSNQEYRYYYDQGYKELGQDNVLLVTRA